jgi:dimethylargininase
MSGIIPDLRGEDAGVPPGHWLALTRDVTPAIARCELTHLARAPIDLGRARAQHAAYERCLADHGCEVRRVAADPDLPDAVFIEDTAVVFDEVAVIARPGAASRRPEIGEVARTLRAMRPLARIEAPATLDGGDVLVIERHVLVGRSARSNDAATDQLARLLEPLGYRVHQVPVTGCLHLKTAVTSPADGLLLLNPEWVDVHRLPGLELLPVDPAEPFAANALRLGGAVLVAATAPRTRERLERRGFPVRTVDMSELAKAEAGLTCCSLIVPRAAG